MVPSGRNHRVAVIGAGVSGLRCASILLEHGIDVTILEARNRIGGRVLQSAAMGPLEVDLGANWVHSKGNNPIVKLAHETETPLFVWKENTMMLDGEGKLIDRKLANKTLGRVWDILEEAMERSKAESELISTDYSLYDEFARVTQAQVENGRITPYERELVLATSEMWGAYVGDSVHRQSMKFFFLEDCIEGDDCFIPTNYRKILAKIASLPLEKAHIMYNTIMKSVDAASTQNNVLVTTTDGQQLKFSDVVITVPHGYLKRHKDKIRPLSDHVSRAIDNISYGHLEKTFIEFPFAFWESSEHATRDDLESGISFIHWLSPTYASATNPKGWRLEVDSFHGLEEPYRRCILLFYTFGECSIHITSSIRDLRGADRDEWLQRFFEPYYSRLPNYDPGTCTPVRYLTTEWSNDEFAGYGSYTNFQIGMQDAAGDVEALRHGMPEHHIYFAGEHTAPFDGLGTATGAYRSGEAVAQRIIDSL